MSQVLMQSTLPFKVRRGKVRDVYELPSLPGRLLFVATDRISAFDWVMPNGIPGKGKILTALSRFWFGFLGYPNHFITDDVGKYPDEVKPYRDQLEGRSMLVTEATVIPIECIVRGYLAGSGWKEYCQSQTLHGESMPAGLRQCDKLPLSRFTPSTKADQGQKDVNIGVPEMHQRLNNLGMGVFAPDLPADSLSIYVKAMAHAAFCGIIIADTKFEFGFRRGSGGLMLVDEVLTPDSSRFWPLDQYEPGRDQPSYDKQYVRNWLEKVSGWDKVSPPPALPKDVVEGTQSRYIEAYERLTGKTWTWN